MKTLSRRDLLKGGLVGGAAIAATAALAGCNNDAAKPSLTPGEAADRVTLPYEEAILSLAKEVMRNHNAYTDSQCKEIPLILRTQTRYFFGNDLQDMDLLRDTLTDEGPNGFQVSMGAGERSLTIDDQINSVVWTLGPQENIVPMHFGFQYDIQFLDDTHARMVLRMVGRHAYNDNGEIVANYGLYVNDYLKCKDSVWRISYIRLSHAIKENALRPVKAMQQGG